MDALVVGAGGMGRWLLDVLGEAGFAVAVADKNPAVAESAPARTVSVDTGEIFDLVCVAVPIPAAGTVVAETAERAGEGMLDVTGTMTGPVAAMREHAPNRERMSAHPLFAPDNEPGNVPVVADAPGPTTDTVRETLVERGNQVFETTPEEHDRVMGTVQAGAHTAVLAYALAAAEVPDRFHTPVSAGLAGLVDDVTGGEGRVYADIQAAFDGADDVAEAAARIAEADHDTFQRLYERL